MQQHTGERRPSGHPNNGGFRVHPSVASLAAAIFLFLFPGPADALKVSVGAATRIDAQATFGERSAGAGRLVVRGTLRDDTGTGIGSEHVAIVFRGVADGILLPVPAPEHCPDEELTDHEPHVAPDEYVVDTSPSGAFCLQAALPEAVRVDLHFAGTGLLEPSQLDVAVATVEAPSFSFEETPSIIALDAPTFTVRARLTPARAGWVARLRDERGHDLGDAALNAQGRVEWTRPTALLAPPGPGVLVASIDAPRTPALSTTLRVERHARVQLDLDAGDHREYRDATPITVAVSWSHGAVPGGWIEARVGARTLVSAPVRDGRATWIARPLPDDAGGSEVELRYWPDAPWWEAGLVRTIRLPPGAHTIRWLRAALVLLAGLMGGWMLRGSLPAARPRWFRRLTQRHRMEGTIPSEMNAMHSAVDGTRTIRVLDAHDETPIAHAAARITVPAFPGARSASSPGPAVAMHDGSPSAHANESSPHQPSTLWAAQAIDGWLHLPPEIQHPEAVLHVASPLHVAVTIGVPRQGTTIVRLVARRRHLLERFAQWAARELGPHRGRLELTPQQVADRARSECVDTSVEDWARAVEHAAFGRSPVDEHVEHVVLALEPKAGVRSGNEKAAR